MRKLGIITLCLLAIYGLARAADVENPFRPPATTCSNQFIRSLAAITGVGTCATVNFALDGTGIVPAANGGAGATTGVLLANGAGLVSAAVAGTNYGQSKLISTTRDLTAATGTQAITGAGFVPTACFIFTAVNGTTASSFGFFDSARTAGSISSTTDGQVTWGWNSATFAVQITNNAATAFQTASVQSYDADGLTLSWTKTGSPTGTLQIKLLCFR